MTPKTYSKFKSILIALLILPYLNSCGLIRDVDPKKVSHDPNERIKRNIEEGRGIRLFGNKKKMVNLILLRPIHYGEHH